MSEVHCKKASQANFSKLPLLHMTHVIDFFGMTFRWNWNSSVARETTCHGAGRF